MGQDRFRFLNVEHRLESATDWNNTDWDKLWLYNLHYFDTLNAGPSHAVTDSGQALIERWIDENPPRAGNGWEPYTLSLRIVNWVKWALAGNQLPVRAVHSLAVQSRYLHLRLEHHLLGNHLFANAKALVFAGVFFSGQEARVWLEEGLAILAREMNEQILPDGGHFERTPMYHNIILEDVLDLVNVIHAYSETPSGKWKELLQQWQRYAARMLYWTRVTTHPDGEIALFNDAAFSIASEPQQLEGYAARLGIGARQPSGELVHLESTGYVRVERAGAWALLDVGAIGPDYLPGHAHADTLSFELSVFGQRVLVDSGTSCYGRSSERLRQRSTSAHNTVELDGVSSSEVWAGFRVARRAYPFDLQLDCDDERLRICCAHDGYRRLRGRPVHRRTWWFDSKGMTVRDRIEGSYKNAVARFHVHPACALTAGDETSGTISLNGGHSLRWSVTQGRARVAASTYHPEFGLTVENTCLEVELEGAEACTRFDWSASP